MKLKTLVASIALSLTGMSAMAAAPSCTSTTAGLAPFSESFTSAGTYTDCYTFSLSGSGNSLSGGLTETASLLTTLGINVASASLYLGSTLLGTDASPMNFSFGSLAGGGYTLAILSTVTAPLLGLGVGAVGYSGSVTAIAAPVPEPGAVALTIAGILGVGAFAWRRNKA